MVEENRTKHKRVKIKQQKNGNNKKNKQKEGKWGVWGSNPWPCGKCHMPLPLGHGWLVNN